MTTHDDECRCEACSWRPWEPALAAVKPRLIKRMLELDYCDEAKVDEKAKVMIVCWDRYQDNSADEYGHVTARDGMDEEILSLLDEALHIRWPGKAA